MGTKKKIIRCPKGLPEKLANEHGVHITTVYDALAFKSNSAKASEIRQQAKALGAVEETQTVFY